MSNLGKSVISPASVGRADQRSAIRRSVESRKWRNTLRFFALRCCRRLRLLTQRVFLDFPGRGLRQRAEYDMARRLVVREIGAAPGDDVSGADLACIGLQRDEGARRLAPSLVRFGDDGGLH